MHDYNFWDYALMYGVMAVWIAAFGAMAISLFLNENPVGGITFAGSALLALLVPGLNEQSAKNLMEDTAFLEAIDKDTPKRSARSYEVLYFGADASKGVVIGASSQERRVHCVTYFDGRQEAHFFRKNIRKKDNKQKPVDLAICQEAGAFSKAG